jgi:pyruvate dehydrogenase E2 component (dihydrolipoamide acetyltransferase)
MANDIVMPRLGWTMESGRLVEWFKQDGEEVAAGELLFAVETDKAIQEVEALDSGVLHIPSDSPLGEEAPVTLTTEIDATELVATRARLKADLAAGGETVPTLTDMLAKLTALALEKHAQLNSALDGETIVQHASIHIGIAVDAERGLYAPVIRNADRKSLFTIAEESAGLIASARAGSLAPDLMSGSTFTITNLGMFGIDAFTPILNLPEAAILGVGRIVAKPVVIDEETEEIAVRKMLTLSLTFDHRIVDGAPAARFLQTLSRMIEHPTSWLMR